MSLAYRRFLKRMQQNPSPLSKSGGFDRSGGLPNDYKINVPPLSFSSKPIVKQDASPVVKMALEKKSDLGSHPDESALPNKPVLKQQSVLPNNKSALPDIKILNQKGGLIRSDRGKSRRSKVESTFEDNEDFDESVFSDIKEMNQLGVKIEEINTAEKAGLLTEEQKQEQKALIEQFEKVRKIVGGSMDEIERRFLNGMVSQKDLTKLIKSMTTMTPQAKQDMIKKLVDSKKERQEKKQQEQKDAVAKKIADGQAKAQAKEQAKADKAKAKAEAKAQAKAQAKVYKAEAEAKAKAKAQAKAQAKAPVGSSSSTLLPTGLETKTTEVEDFDYIELNGLIQEPELLNQLKQKELDSVINLIKSKTGKDITKTKTAGPSNTSTSKSKAEKLNDIKAVLAELAKTGFSTTNQDVNTMSKYQLIHEAKSLHIPVTEKNGSYKTKDALKTEIIDKRKETSSLTDKLEKITPPSKGVDITSTSSKKKNFRSQSLTNYQQINL